MSVNAAYRVIDSHAHMGPVWNFYLPYNDEQGMLDNMDTLGVDTVVFSSNLAVTADVVRGNRYTLEVCKRHPGRFLGMLAINPNYPEVAVKEIPEYFSHKEIVGLKIHPELAGDYPLNGKNCELMFRYASEHKTPILSHTYYGGDRLSVFEELAKEYPDAPLIIGHGALDLGTGKAIDLCNKYPNLYYDLCSPVNKRYGAMLLVDKELDPDKAIFGTDSPWNDPAVSLGSVLLSGAAPEKLHKWLSGNFLRLYTRAALALDGGTAGQ
jgi:predicted TIM-barrel fold metal-dependent hydrolase